MATYRRHLATLAKETAEETASFPLEAEKTVAEALSKAFAWGVDARSAELEKAARTDASE